MRVNELFTGIMGESSFVGVPAAFVRLQGCDVYCTHCDTKYAQNPNGGKKMTVKQVVKWVEKKRLHTVLVTGGSPEMHEDFDKLVRYLAAQHKVVVETSGCHKINWLLPCHWVVDIKPPSAGKNAYTMSRKFLRDCQPRVAYHSSHQAQVEWKIVLDFKNQSDFRYFKKVLYELPDFSRVYVSATQVGGLDKYRKTLQEFIPWLIKFYARRGPWPKLYLNAQLHKLIYGINKRGV